MAHDGARTVRGCSSADTVGLMRLDNALEEANALYSLACGS